MVGDVSRSEDREPWHRHYKPEEITAFCPPSLILDRAEVYFPAQRGMMAARVAAGVLTGGRPHLYARPMNRIDRRLSEIRTKTGDQLVMAFTKRG